jgi:hypothetical protein
MSQVALSMSECQEIRRKEIRQSKHSGAQISRRHPTSGQNSSSHRCIATIESARQLKKQLFQLSVTTRRISFDAIERIVGRHMRGEKC